MISKELKTKVIGGFQKKEGDTGSIEVQVALLTEKISALTAHLNKETKDYSSKRGLIKMVHRRATYLKYLKKNDSKSYHDIISKLGLRK